VRRVVTGWVLVVVPVLLINLSYLVLSLPRIVATGWDSASRLIGQLDGGGAATAWAAVQLGLLVLPMLGISYTMLRTTRRASAGAWRWSAGSSVRRLGVVTGGFLLLAALLVAWWPDGRVSPYRSGENGTLQQQVRQLHAVGTGTPLLRAPKEAQQPLPPLAPGESAVVNENGGATTTEPSDTSTTQPTPDGSSGADSSPAPEESAAAEVSDAPSPEPTGADEPIPSPTG
jgi:putative peptide zinc metalloprotease protein